MSTPSAAKPAKKPQPEHRWAVGVSIVIALALYFFIPQRVQPLPFWLVPAVGVLLLVPLVILNPRRLVNERTWSRWISIALAIILVVVNQITIVLTFRELIAGKTTGPAVLLTAAMVWAA